jgi:hypothetical protein
MQPVNATRERSIPSIGNDELAEGLMLVRASTLKVIRLQLAMERRDRRVALETVDDLVALDRSLEDFLAQVPTAQQDGMFGNFLELERSALNVEKHTLAAGISHRDWQVETPAPEPEEIAEPAADEWMIYDDEKAEGPNWWLRIGAFALIVAIACGAYFLGASGILPDLVARLL